MSLHMSLIRRSLKGLLLGDASTSFARSRIRGFTSRVVSPATSNSSYNAEPRLPLPLHTTKENEVMSNSLFRLSPPKLQIIDKPNPFRVSIIDLPQLSNLGVEYEDVRPNVEIQEPDTSRQEEKQAARMVVIRRKKMRVHKLKKLKKKMHYENAKFKLRREIKREKEFQAGLFAKIREAEKFNPALYVKQKLEEAHKQPVQKRWKGKRLPEFIIKMEIESAKKKYQANLARAERRKNMNVNASDYP